MARITESHCAVMYNLIIAHTHSRPEVFVISVKSLLGRINARGIDLLD